VYILKYNNIYLFIFTPTRFGLKEDHFQGVFIVVKITKYHNKDLKDEQLHLNSFTFCDSVC
jgi:hypothetical protein